MDQITQLATQIRSLKSKNPNTLALPISLLNILLNSIESIVEQQQSSAILVRQNSNPVKNEQFRDIHFLHQYLQMTKHLKLYEDRLDPASNDDQINISKLSNIVSVEFYKVDVNTVKGMQMLRSQIQKLVCYHTNNTLNDVLTRCGGDESDGYCWSELKEIIFTKNGLYELDSSLECVPWLNTLDLSHNNLKVLPTINCLPNLKYFNLSFNKLESVPKFKGQICSRLQNFVLKNNFIEDISGLQSLVNLSVLDLSNNCIVDHKPLLAISHLATLQWLNLTNNPLTFHPHHRNKTASCLHLNTMSTNFILNLKQLSQNEKKFIGSLFPTQMKRSYGSGDIQNDSVSVSSDRICRVREVTIEDECLGQSPSSTFVRTKSDQYLETKKQIETLREQYGESWLNAHSGALLQNVLGLEAISAPIVSSSPYEADFTIHSNIVHNTEVGRRKEEQSNPEFSPAAQDVLNKTEDSFVTAFDTTTKQTQDKSDAEESDFESDADLYLEGEKNIYVVTSEDGEQLLVVITKLHLCEQDASTMNERVRWHLNSVINCQILARKVDEEQQKGVVVQLDFETMRKDRKQRVYMFEEDDVEQFVAYIRERIESRVVKDNDNIKYQCMKCDTKFSRNKKVLEGEEAVQCPNCDSNLIVENNN